MPPILNSLDGRSLPAGVPALEKPPRLADPALYINRELSWLEFNARVLDEARADAVPLFERVKFLSIFSANLDEFFMVRVAGLQAQLSQEVEDIPPDGATPNEQLEMVSERAHELFKGHCRVWNKSVRPALADAGIALVDPNDLAAPAQKALDAHFDRNIFPALTPISIDPSHPFPHVRNKALNVGVVFGQREDMNEPEFGLVQMPMGLPRLLPVPLDNVQRAFVTLEALIFRRLGSIFPQMKIKGRFAFRVTRNFDIQVDDDEAEDLLISMQAELRKRERGEAVRLELGTDAPDEAIQYLCRRLELNPDRDVYQVDAPVNFPDLAQMVSGDERRRYRDEAFSPQYVPPFRDSEEFFDVIRERDVLLHHPYESFEAVVDFLSQAAEDPDVIAIKQTLYRSGGESPLVRALQRAAELGKQVTALVELKARFDEASNIQWAHALERSGVNVMYGLVGLKLHAKVLLVVRREAGGLQRYVHLATGNYNQQTARLYEDVSLFTAKEEIAEDATALFNLLTGYSAPERWNELVVAPAGLKIGILGLIQRETDNARAGKPGRIIAKMNSLVDQGLVAALYEASQAGVSIDLLVRGICCLKPGVPGLSENIRVFALIDRFLEHARIFYFENGGDRQVFCSSADWMPRNLIRRIEVMFPILDPQIRSRVIEEILETMKLDDAKAWQLGPDGRYSRVVPRNADKPFRSQTHFMELARDRVRDPPLTSHPINYALAKPPKNKRKKRRGRQH